MPHTDTTPSNTWHVAHTYGSEVDWPENRTFPLLSECLDAIGSRPNQAIIVHPGVYVETAVIPNVLPKGLAIRGAGSCTRDFNVPMASRIIFIGMDGGPILKIGHNTHIDGVEFIAFFSDSPVDLGGDLGHYPAQMPSAPVTMFDASFAAAPIRNYFALSQTTVWLLFLKPTDEDTTVLSIGGGSVDVLGRLNDCFLVGRSVGAGSTKVVGVAAKGGLFARDTDFWPIDGSGSPVEAAIDSVSAIPTQLTSCQFWYNSTGTTMKWPTATLSGTGGFTLQSTPVPTSTVTTTGTIILVEDL